MQLLYMHTGSIKGATIILAPPSNLIVQLLKVQDSGLTYFNMHMAKPVHYGHTIQGHAWIAS